MVIELIKTGVQGLDILLKGGLRKNSTMLVTGAPGTGKTILALNFIFYGAKDYGDNGIFITTEEKLEDLKDFALNLGMDITPLEKAGKIFLVKKPLTSLRGGISSIKGLIDAIKKNNVKRVALDSVTFFEYLYPKFCDDRMEFRRQILIFMHQLKEAGVTFLAVSEKPLTDMDKISYDMTDFIFEGVILLSRIRKGSYFERVITVAKVRGQDHSLDLFPTKIDNSGFRILHDQTPFSLVEKEDKQSFK